VNRTVLGLVPFVLALPAELRSQVSRSCETTASAVRLDHVVVAVRDLDAASDAYRGLGFTLKEGRLHRNGIRNRHAKLRDGFSLELLTIDGEPGGETAARYAEFLAEGEGAAYLALRAEPSEVVDAASRAGIEAFISGERGFTYATLADPDLAAVFFLGYETPVTDPAGIVTHANGVVGVDEVRIEAGRSLEALLEALGAVRCRAEAEDLPGRYGVTFAVDGGRVTLLRTPGRGKRPRVRGVRLLSIADSSGERHLPPDRTHGVWLSLVPMPSPVPGAPDRDAGP
jgi:catechol 2,3-dioxygenase-like lactoylglutathione lyase family enzyme